MFFSFSPRHLKTLTLLFIFSSLFALNACGRKGSPIAPGPKSDIIYPRMYPAE